MTERRVLYSDVCAPRGLAVRTQTDRHNAKRSRSRSSGPYTRSLFVALGSIYIWPTIERYLHVWVSSKMLRAIVSNCSECGNAKFIDKLFAIPSFSGESWFKRMGFLGVWSLPSSTSRGYWNLFARHILPVMYQENCKCMYKIDELTP